MSAQPLTQAHESFQNRLARIERNQLRQAAGGRANARMYRRPIGSRGVARRPMRNSKSPQTVRIVLTKLSLVARLKSWSFGCLIGGCLTLGKAVMVNVDALYGFAGLSAELLFSAIWVAYLFFFLVVTLGLLRMRQNPSFAQFSVALGATMILGLI